MKSLAPFDVTKIVPEIFFFKYCLFNHFPKIRINHEQTLLHSEQGHYAMEHLLIFVDNQYLSSVQSNKYMCVCLMFIHIHISNIYYGQSNSRLDHKLQGRCTCTACAFLLAE